MTKVEELRDEVYLTLVDDYDGYGNEDSKKSAAKLVDALIYAVRLEEIERIKRSDACARGDKGESGVV